MIDTVKGTITYLTAAIVTVLSMVLVYLAWATPPVDGGRDIGILTGFLGLIVGAAVAFLFTREAATQATKAAAAQTAAATPTVTVDAGPPASATVTSSVPHDAVGPEI